MSKHGGKRPNSGRKPGSTAKASTDQIMSMSELARAHGPAAIDVLANVMAKSDSDAAKVSAATQLLDRAYGKPIQSTEVSGKDGKPIEFADVSPNEAARRIAFVFMEGQPKT